MRQQTKQKTKTNVNQKMEDIYYGEHDKHKSPCN